MGVDHPYLQPSGVRGSLLCTPGKYGNNTNAVTHVAPLSNTSDKQLHLRSRLESLQLVLKDISGPRHSMCDSSSQF